MHTRGLSELRTKRLVNIGAQLLGAMFCISAPLLAATGKPIISGGTVKTADGQILRGCCAHVAKCAGPAIRQFFTIPANVKRMRDQAHLNTIRICCLDPWAYAESKGMEPWSGGFFTKIDSILPTVDAIIANCESLGVVPILNYHYPRISENIEASSCWKIESFWDVMAARYKDHPAVIFEMYNENWVGTSWMSKFSGNDAENSKTVLSNIYNNHVRKWAPNNVVLHLEAMGIEGGTGQTWANFLKNQYAPALGFSWSSGKDAFPLHAYAGDSSPNDYNPFKTSGIPIVCTEYSFVEEDWVMCWESMGVCDPNEWFEKNGISWMVWQQWQSGEPDQLKSIMDYMLPDAVARNYTWWSTTRAIEPRASVQSSMSGLRNALVVTANGRAIGVKPGHAARADLAILPRSMETPRSR